ncbi:MAG: threonyl-tRNA synthetase editing domain-containing protein [Firmicutes bacterium]|nr:threonyl-tRNA synthetase editing domain-containing protein [Bacillota bacterium]MCL5039278.1 threonyl-tRNA synthetase editing domain-containing protein [Bacillota bacterium]
MRFLALHVDHFRSEITEKGRTRLIEPAEPKVSETGEALVLLVSVEKGDEPAPKEVAVKAAGEISTLASQLGVQTIVLHPFAHLFAELAAPPIAIEIMDQTRCTLSEKGYQVVRTPFGWFNTLEIKAKGHPLSRVARRIEAPEETAWG